MKKVILVLSIVLSVCSAGAVNKSDYEIEFINIKEIKLTPEIQIEKGVYQLKESGFLRWAWHSVKSGTNANLVELVKQGSDSAIFRVALTQDPAYSSDWIITKAHFEEKNILIRLSETHQNRREFEAIERISCTHMCLQTMCTSDSNGQLNCTPTMTACSGSQMARLLKMQDTYRMTLNFFNTNAPYEKNEEMISNTYSKTRQQVLEYLSNCG